MAGSVRSKKMKRSTTLRGLHSRARGRIDVRNYNEAGAIGLRGTREGRLKKSSGFDFRGSLEVSSEAQM